MPADNFLDVSEEVFPVGADPKLVDATFHGVTIVRFGPVDYDRATQKSWYWMTPIIDAIKNGDRDVSGFKFSPKPQIDFGKSGPFGFLTAVAIAVDPSLKIVVKSSDYTDIRKSEEVMSSDGLNFLGARYSFDKSLSTDLSTVSGDTPVTLDCEPDAGVVAGETKNSRAWVLGAQTNYPAA